MGQALLDHSIHAVGLVVCVGAWVRHFLGVRL